MQCKQPNLGHFRQNKNPGQDVSHKKSMYGHPKYAAKSSECRDAAVIIKMTINYLSVLLWNSIQSGMILSYGCTGGLPEIAKIMQYVILERSVSFTVKNFGAWSSVHQALDD